MKRILTLLLLTALALGGYQNNPWTISEITTVAADHEIGDDEFFTAVNTDTAAVELTLPLIADLQGNVVTQFDIGHFVGEYNVKLVCDSTDKFIYGNTYFNLGTEPFRNAVAVFPDGPGKWGLVGNLTIYAVAHRNASWAASNFSSMTVVPWDNESANTQDELLVYTSGSSARYTVKTPGTYRLSYVVDIDSTGGVTWRIVSEIHKNGTVITDTRLHTGNYGNEDQSLTLSPTYIELDTDDYIDLRVDQDNLTGNITHSMLLIELEL